MSSPGQRRGSCGQAMAGFDSHSKCAHCRDKGLGDDPCVQKKECAICRGFTPEQTLQLSTPSYRDRKDKKATASSSTPTLMDSAHVSVLGKVEVKAVQSTPTTANKTKRSESPKPSANKKKSSSSRPSAEDLKQLDDKWAERFSRLEAMLLAKTFTVPVEPVVKPASDVTTSQKPIFDPGATTSKLAVEKSGPCFDQTTGEAVEEMQNATQPLGAPGAGIATQPVQAPGSFPEVQPTGEEDLSAASDSEADQLSVTGSLDEEIHRDRSADRDVSRDDPDSEPTEAANSRETMTGVRSFMNWHKVPEFETVSSTADDTPFASARVRPTGKVSVKLPVDDWLCPKMSSLNLTLTEGYPTRNTDNMSLLRDQFIKTPRSSRWYGMHAEKDSESTTVRTWSPDPAKLNHCFSRVARRNLPTAPPSRAFSQDLLRRWERAAREQTIMCNQAAGLSRCLTRVQDSMATQLKTLRLDSKGKSPEKMKQAVNELEYLTTFNRSISQAMARSMQDLSEGIFINMANFTLARRDSFLDYLQSGVKQDTVNALRTSPVHLNALFLDQLIAKASTLTLQVTSLRVTTTGNLPSRLGNRLKTSNKPGRVMAKPQHSPRSRPRGSSLINDNHCVISVTGQKNSVHVTSGSREQQSDFKFECRLSCCKCSYCHRVATKERRKSHLLSNVHRNKICEKCFLCRSLEFCKSCQQCPHAVIDPPVGARLHRCWEKWEALGSSPKVVTTLREGYTLPFRFRPHLTRSPTVISNYHNSAKQSFLIEALYQLINKNAVEPVQNQNSLGFYNWLFLVPKPKNRWRPVLDLSTLNTFLNTESFKMETPETIRTSLQAGEWVTSIDFKDAYFHIPIHNQSRKYMRFHLQGRSYQFKALPFGVSTAPMEFTVVAKEVKLMALQKGITIHQYLDDWLVRASTHDTCLQHTQTLVTLCQELGWLVNKEKSELVPKQFDLKEGRVRPTEERWQTLTNKIRSILSDPVCLVRQFMSLIGLLTATEKQVHLGRLHMRPIQWHLKNNWRVPESLEKVIPVPNSLHPHLKWWLEESNVLLGQPLHPLKHALQIFTDASKEGWGAHLDEHTARGTWSLPESKLHINHLELKAVFLALKEFRTLCYNKTVLIATDNTTVVAYINKEGGMKSGLAVCPTVENPVLVYQTAGNP